MTKAYFQAFTSPVLALLLAFIGFLARPQRFGFRGMMVLALGLMGAGSPAFAATQYENVSLTTGTSVSGFKLLNTQNRACGNEQVETWEIISGSVPSLTLSGATANSQTARLDYSGVPTTPGINTVSMVVGWRDYDCNYGGTEFLDVTFTVMDPAPTAADVSATVAANSTGNAITL